jgi:hypothetical protein
MEPPPAIDLRTSALLTVPHGFTTRATGSLRTVADRGRVFGGKRLLVARQVHGRHVLTLRGDESSDEIAAREADGLVLTPGVERSPDGRGASGDVAVGVLTADCLPVLFWDPVSGVVGAAHAGWRGLHAGVLEAVVAAMQQLGASASTVRAAFGASIGPCCFEVGDEVAAAFHQAYPEGRAAIGSHPRSPKPHVDLRQLAAVALARVGLTSDRIDGAPPCTRCSPPSAHFSFRREGAGCGLQLAFVHAGS